MAQIMSNIFQSVHDSGDLTGTYRDTVLIRGAVSIQDAVFESDLILANGLGEKALGLNNITVKGRLVVWGGSAVNISGKSTVAGVVTPRNDGPVQVVFDAAAAELSEKGCSIVYPSGMDKGNKVLFIDKADKPTIAFDLPAYRYVGDSVSVKTTLTGAEAVTWELTRDGKSIAMPEGFTKDGGICYFMEAGRYVLRGTVENSGGKAYCEKTVEVLPIGDIAFSLPEYGYTDRTEDVKLLLKNDLDGSMVWTLTKDGANQPLASFTKEGGTLALTETGKYTLTATLTDAAGKQYTASQSITILPVIVPTVTASAEKVHDGGTVEIGLTVEGGKPDSVRWTLTRDGKEVPVTLSANGGTLTFDGAGDYILTAIAKDAQGREFSSEPVTIKVIPNLSLSLTSDLEKLHEDEAAAISLTVEHGTPSTVAWALTHDGEGVPVSLDDHGGKLAFDGAGAYVLTVTVTDEPGKEYTAALPLDVYPVIVLTLDAPETAHVDQPAAVSLSGTDLDVAWEVTSEDGAVVENALTNSGGEITFPSASNYTVTASVTDGLGRTFSTSETISVWDTMSLSFKLPEFAHPDETVKVKMTSENVGDSKIAWSLTVDGQPVSLSAGIAGTLDNAGGSVKFLQTGTNVLTASATDSLGRAFTYEQAIEVYPVLSLTLTADAATHTDEQISVTLEKDTALPVVWKITPSNAPSAAMEYTGNLTDNGGTIQITSAGAYDISASRTVTVVISKHPGAPVLVFDPNGETLNTTPDMEYSTDGGKTWKPCPNPLDVSDLAGKDVLIRYPGKGDGLPGETVTVKIPDRRKAPSVGHTDETRQGRNDGTFTKTDKTMEYRLLPDGKWTAITGNTVRGLAPGTYEVRYAATASEMASQVQKVTIAKGGSTGGIGDLTTPGSKLSLLNRKDHIAYIAGRTTTQAAPNADITRAEVAAILYRLLTPEAKAAYGTNINRFKDVPAGAWYGTAVSTLCNMGVITGYQDGTFGPQRNITRAELATILARFCDSSGNNTVLDRFTDISHSWARKYINLAAEAGLVYGYTDGTFRPDQNITRAETIVMVNRILGRSVNADTVVKGYKTFSDVPTGAWYYWDIVEASNGHSFSMDGSTEKWTALG